jgi:hypothetical protein
LPWQEDVKIECIIFGIMNGVYFELVVGVVVNHSTKHLLSLISYLLSFKYNLKSKEKDLIIKGLEALFNFKSFPNLSKLRLSTY